MVLAKRPGSIWQIQVNELLLRRLNLELPARILLSLVGDTPVTRTSVIRLANYEWCNVMSRLRDPELYQ